MPRAGSTSICCAMCNRTSSTKSESGTEMVRSSSYLRWISTSMMGVYVKITRHYSHNRFHPCHPTPGNMCHWRRRLDSPVPARFIQTTDRSDDNPFAMCPEHRHTTRDTARSSVRPVRKNVTEIKVLMELQLIS